VRVRGRFDMGALAAVGLFATSWASTASATSLPSYDVDPQTVTVAGISSGAFMAVQLQVAYSSRIHGAAIIAGGPYDCAQGSASTATGPCASGIGLPSTSTLVAYAATQAASGAIDATSHIGGKPIYMFSGTNDATVHPPVMDALELFYEQFTSGSNITYDNTTDAAHAWISPLGPNPCTLSYTPFISNCGIDVEQTFLTRFYGALAPKASAPSGSFIQFDQTEFCPSGDCASISMDSTGWAYVPPSCASGAACRLVVALHGCGQYQGLIQQQFVKDSGLDEWADTNAIVVLYPQATPMAGNALGCWDWWGYTGPSYAVKAGAQPTALMAMVSRVTERAGDGGSAGDASSSASVDASTPPPSSDASTSPPPSGPSRGAPGATDGAPPSGASHDGSGCGIVAVRRSPDEAPLGASAVVVALLTRRVRRKPRGGRRAGWTDELRRRLE
jgi:poly(3-hydroxybutyrate) depolymerase